MDSSGETLLGERPRGTVGGADTAVVVGSWVLVTTSVPRTDLSGDGAPVTGSDAGVGAIDVDAECRTVTASSTFVEGVAEVV